MSESENTGSFENKAVAESRDLFHQVMGKIDALPDENPEKIDYKTRANALYRSMDVQGLLKMLDEFHRMENKKDDKK